MDFLKKVYSSQYSPEVVEHLVQKLRGSTRHQYEVTWSSFLTFLNIRKPKSIDIPLMTEFITSMFSKGYGVATIRTAKCALSEPLLKGFNVDLSADVFKDLSRSFGLQRPARRPQTISWSLTKVLDLFQYQSYTGPSASIAKLQQKTILLTALACGGRISEISALQRGENFIRPSGSDLLLSPARDFLAKNENPQCRRDPIRIRSLDSDPSLCPVRTIKEYLKRTSNVKTGSLFIHHDKQSALSKVQVSTKMLSLIRTANPGSFPKTHDVRKYATSLAFLNETNFPDLASYTGWSSVKVFLKHYRRELEDMRHSVVATGTITSVHAQAL